MAADTTENWARLVDQAATLVVNDEVFMRTLIQARKDSGLTLEEMSARLGMSVESIEAIEHYTGDPRLSELRRYALAIDIQIKHEVKEYDDSTNGAHKTVGLRLHG